MSKLLISTGTNPNDGNGDTLLAGAGKVNSNFNEIYSSLGNGSDLNIGVGKTVISTNSLGNVGIGTTNPDKPLHIYTADGDVRIGDITEGTATTDAGVIFTGLGSNTSAIFTEVNGTLLSYGINCSQITNVETGRAGGIFRLDTRTSGTYASSNCFVVKGKPIGTTSEYNALAVGLNDGNTHLSPERGDVLVGTSSSTGTASQRFQVNSGAYISGSVGVGTTNPTSKLQVVGDVLISGITTIGLGSTSSPPQNSQLTFELTSNTNLRIKVRGTDGVIRMSNITLAP